MRLRSSETTEARRAALPSAETLGNRQMLGELLSLSADNMQKVESRQAETGLLFGDAAVDLGLVSNDQVQRAIELQQGFPVLAEGDERIDPLVVAAFQPSDAVAAMARDVRAIVTRGVRSDGTPVQSVAIVGVDHPTLHTAILSANLAVACAQAGYATLLIDGSIGVPRQHGLFRLSNRAGLSSLLSSGGRADGFIQATAIAGLSLLSAGPAVPNMSELFDRQRLANTLDPLRDQYGIIIFDAGPSGSSKAEACFGLDAAIVVARRNTSDARALRAAVSVLKEHGTPTLGSILTD